MKILKGTLKNLKVFKIDSIENAQKLVFSLDNNVIELDTTNYISAQNGDEVIVAGIVESNKVFTAYSLKKIS